ncbi:MAG: hypothetical protein EOO02_20495, partial [Chitinophagaceae bacterium]
MLSSNTVGEAYCLDLSGSQNPPTLLRNFNELILKHRAGRELPVILFSDVIPPVNKLKEVCGNMLQKNNRAVFILVVKRRHAAAGIPWDYLETGIQDIVEWTNEEDMLQYVLSFAEREKMVSEILHSSLIRKNLIGSSRTWLNFLRNIIEAALFSQGAILLQGESGTGKELISRLV